MIMVPPQASIYVHCGFTDFRKGIDGLIGICKYDLQKDPFNGALFVFSNRTRKSLKILVYDGQGFWLCQKRLSEGRLKYWPQGPHDETGLKILANELLVLIWNGDYTSSKMQSNWKELTPLD